MENPIFVLLWVPGLMLPSFNKHYHSMLLSCQYGCLPFPRLLASSLRLHSLDFFARSREPFILDAFVQIFVSRKKHFCGQTRYVRGPPLDQRMRRCRASFHTPPLSRHKTAGSGHIQAVPEYFEVSVRSISGARSGLVSHDGLEIPYFCPCRRGWGSRFPLYHLCAIETVLFTSSLFGQW